MVPNHLPYLKWCIFRCTQITTGNGNGTFQNSAPGRLRAVGPPQFGVPGRRFRSLQKEPCPRPERLNTNSKQTSTLVGLFGRVGVELRCTVGLYPKLPIQSTTEPMPHRHVQPLGHAIANNASCFYQLLSHRVEVASTLHPPKWPPRSIKKPPCFSYTCPATTKLFPQSWSWATREQLEPGEARRRRASATWATLLGCCNKWPTNGRSRHKAFVLL